MIFGATDQQHYYIDKITTEAVPVNSTFKIKESGTVQSRFVYENLEKAIIGDKLANVLLQASDNVPRAKFYHIQNSIFVTAAVESNKLYFLKAYDTKTTGEETKICGGSNCLWCGPGGCLFCLNSDPLVKFIFNGKTYDGCK